jgi:hypothetical protein
MRSPSPNGPNDRDTRGRFAKGNTGGVDEAKGGDVRAAKEVIDRCLGRPVEADLIERIEHLELLAKERAG